MAEAGQGHYPYQAAIDAYGNNGFRFADMSHRGSLLCLPSGMHAWPVTALVNLQITDLQLVIALAEQIDVLFIGMGDDIAPVPGSIRDALREHGIVVEGLSTGSAISSYNILLSEHRAVAAALMAAERPSRVKR